MRRILGLFGIVLVLVGLLSTTAEAASGAPSVNINVVVSNDGSCRVTQVVNFYLERAVEDLTYPLPRDARDVTVNGSSVRPSRSGTASNVKLNRFFGNVTGSFTATFSYTLNGLVDYNNDGLLMLELPLLWGFAYPVDYVDFTITLPGNVENRPAFTSGYFKARIEEDMEVHVEGNTIHGQVLSPLKDRETLTMELMVDNAMFPFSARAVWTAGTDDLAMAVCAVLALAYWLIFLRCLPVRRVRRASAPDGVGAGELGSVMVMAGADLTMMVVSWAQMGYILIQLDNNGRVLLHKRMEMGNERGNFERRIFGLLFGKRTIIDGTGYHYARLCRKVAAGKPNIQVMYDRSSGNPLLFRLLALAAAPLGGLSLGLALGMGGFFGGLVTFLLVVLGLVSGWFIQRTGKCLHLRHKLSLYVGLGLCGAWLLVGLWAGELTIALLVSGGELVAGIMAAYGGKRTELGRQTLQQIYGLRHNLKHPSREELLRIMKQNPLYYYNLAPYALAFGVDKAFAKGFGGLRLGGCPYLTTGMDGHLTASDWSKLLRQAVNILDERQRKLPLERLLNR